LPKAIGPGIICWTVRNKPERSLQGCKANGPTNEKGKRLTMAQG